MKDRIIDRRETPRGKNLPNRQRFLQRQRAAVKKAVRRKVSESEVEEMASGEKKRIRIPTKGIEEPMFQYDGKTGSIEFVLPGNKEYVPGDLIPRPPCGQGQGSKGSPDGEGEDDFEFEITSDEFLDYIFEDLELPDMVRKSLAHEEEFELERYGLQSSGPPAKMELVRSMHKAHERKLVLRGKKRKEKRRLEQEQEDLQEELKHVTDAQREQEINDRLSEIDEELVVLERKLRSIPFIDDIDIQYRRDEEFPVPITQAVMFCLMDVSGSMTQWDKEVAKRFFLLLYLFMNRNYQRVEIVFVRHTHEAAEVDENEFFYSKETGGTKVSAGLDLINQIVKDRFPISEWNLYCCHASDGDNWEDDENDALNLMNSAIMPMMQYFAYVEIVDESKGGATENSNLWQIYEAVTSEFSNIGMTSVRSLGDIFQVFRGLFKRKKESQEDE